MRRKEFAITDTALSLRQAREQAIFDETCVNIVQHILERIESQQIEALFERYLVERHEYRSLEAGIRTGNRVVESAPLARDFLDQARAADRDILDALEALSAEIARACSHKQIRARVLKEGFVQWLKKYASDEVLVTPYLRYLDRKIPELLSLSM